MCISPWVFLIILHGRSTKNDGHICAQHEFVEGLVYPKNSDVNWKSNDTSLLVRVITPFLDKNPQIFMKFHHMSYTLVASMSCSYCLTNRARWISWVPSHRPRRRVSKLLRAKNLYEVQHELQQEALCHLGREMIRGDLMANSAVPPTLFLRRGKLFWCTIVYYAEFSKQDLSGFSWRLRVCLTENSIHRLVRIFP